MTDPTTRAWIRNESDERAAANGCRFDVLRGAWTVWWIERYCRLYEGEGYAGQPVVMHGCHECDHSEFYAIQEDFWLDAECTIPGPAQELHAERARLFAECVKNGHRIDWQYECHMRLYGWSKYRKRWDTKNNGRRCRRFRQGSIWIPKKSKKSPTLAANGMYLLCGDGEPGQKVFLAAKDGEQARMNAAKHTVEMLYQCPELYDRENPKGGICTLNHTKLLITHEPSRSVMYPLSSSNARTQKSKEGLNGSFLIDETHVVDRPFVDTISRGGISRSEPLFLEFSTAGNNPDSYGKERFDYTAAVLDGRENDEELFGAIYAVPQDITEEQLEKDFDHYARMSNPSLGHTIDPEDLRSDYERSKRKIEDLSTCLMYRFNKWQHSSNPWLRPSDWLACASEYTEADLLHKTCFGGLDLSLKWDLTAFVLLFPWGEDEDGQPRFRVWPYMFMPEISARQIESKVQVFGWGKAGELIITDGDTTDFPLVRRTIKEASKKFDLQAVAYDDRFAESFIMQLKDEDFIDVLDFNQNPQNFAEPLGLLWSDVTSHRLEHPNNACLNWQAGNATINRKGMLVKPESDDCKKIDGITAAVMARGMAAAAPKTLTGTLFYSGAST